MLGICGNVADARTSCRVLRLHAQFMGESPSRPCSDAGRATTAWEGKSAVPISQASKSSAATTSQGEPTLSSSLFSCALYPLKGLIRDSTEICQMSSVLSFTPELCVAFKSHLPRPTAASHVHPDVPLASRLHAVCSPAPHKPPPTASHRYWQLHPADEPSSKPRSWLWLLSLPRPGFWGPVQKSPTIPFPLRGSDSNILGSPSRRKRRARRLTTEAVGSGAWALADGPTVS